VITEAQQSSHSTRQQE